MSGIPGCQVYREVLYTGMSGIPECQVYQDVLYTGMSRDVRYTGMACIQGCQVYQDDLYTGMSGISGCPVYRDVSLFVIYWYFRNCVYMESGTSRLTGIPVEATEIPVRRDMASSI